MKDGKKERERSKPKLYSYVVERDNGFAPNPYWGVCTLANCKSSEGKKSKGKSIVDRAKKGDWVVGTGGKSDRSAGRHGTLIYVMRVDKIRTLAEYFDNGKFEAKRPITDGTYKQQQGDNEERDCSNRRGRVLISRHFLYYGRNAVDIPQRFREHPRHPLDHFYSLCIP